MRPKQLTKYFVMSEVKNGPSGKLSLLKERGSRNPMTLTRMRYTVGVLKVGSPRWSFNLGWETIG